MRAFNTWADVVQVTAIIAIPIAAVFRTSPPLVIIAFCISGIGVIAFILNTLLTYGFAKPINRTRSPRAKIPAASPGITITAPCDREIVDATKIEVHGTYETQPAGRWVVMTQNADRFWVHSGIGFEEKDRTWKGSVTLAPAQTKPQKVLIVELTDELRGPVEFYWEVGPRLGWPGIKLLVKPEHVAASVNVRSKLPAATATQ